LETGSVLRKKDSGRPTKRTVENIEEVEQRTPNKSIPRLAQKTNLSFDTVHLIIKKIGTFFPMMCLLWMKLHMKRRVTLCLKALGRHFEHLV
jgi:hypothetical protein